MMRHINVSGGYADFKTVMGLLGKPKAVFWWRSPPEQACIAAVMDDWTIVHVTVPKPPETAPSPASPTGPSGTPSPFTPSAAGQGRQTAPDTQSKPEGKAEGKADAGGAAKSQAGAEPPKQQADRPKTQLETDFPGAIELPGGGIVFS